VRWMCRRRCSTLRSASASVLLLCACADASSAVRRQIKKDQLEIIFDVIGTPTREQVLARARTREVSAVGGVVVSSVHVWRRAAVHRGVAWRHGAGARVPDPRGATSADEPAGAVPRRE
jgi:hypothetical protein